MRSVRCCARIGRGQSLLIGTKRKGMKEAPAFTPGPHHDSREQGTSDTTERSYSFSLFDSCGIGDSSPNLANLTPIAAAFIRPLQEFFDAAPFLAKVREAPVTKALVARKATRNFGKFRSQSIHHESR